MSSTGSRFRRSGLADYKQIGKELIPPFLQIGVPIEQVFWLRDILPEFLWIDALVYRYGNDLGNRTFNRFLSVADSFSSHPTDFLDGTVGAFGLVSEDKRSAFREQHQEEIEAAVLQPFGDVLALYPACPMAWLASERPPARDESVNTVRASVLRLFDGKSPHPALCRALPLNRFFAHRKIRISNNLQETIEALKTYPAGDRERVEAFARNIHNSLFMRRAQLSSDVFAWARAFWDCNRSIVGCRND